MIDKVYCTADGDYPEKNQIVIFEVDGDAFVGACYDYDLDCGSYWFGESDDITDFHPITEPIYWKPLTSLKAQYELQQVSK